MINELLLNKKVLKRSILFSILMLIFSLTACMNEEKFETSAGDRLTFSVDTLQMDTVIAGTGSVTRSFTIYNKNSDGISITAISFLGGISNGFRVNVDGTYINGSLPMSIDCRSKDSLLVFAEITPAESNQDYTINHEATLVFTLANGIQQTIVLQAYSQDVILLKNVHITTNTTLSAQRPYLVTDSLTVEEGATLSLTEGVRLFFKSNAGMLVKGKLLAVGTRAHPIVFRGDRMDYMFTDQPYDRVSAQWQGLEFATESYGNKLNFCDIHSGTYGILCDSSDVNEEKLRMENSILHNMSGNCLETYASKLFIGNSQLSNAGGNVVCLYGGDAEFIHCTLGQFYPFSGLRGPALAYANYYNNVAFPLVNALFYNCIITGYSEDEIMGDKSEKFSFAAFNYGFYNCLLNTPKIENDDRVVGNVWDLTTNKVHRESNFRKFDYDRLTYDFHLDSLSVARNAADASISQQYYPIDLSGVSRLSDGQSDAGCYEFVAGK